MNYFLIPGNPPAVHFYELWAKEIQSHHPGAQVRVSPYPAIGTTTDSEKAMQEVLKGHLEQLEDFYHTTESPVTLIGHSLGGYFAIGLLETVPDWIHKVILVHPFLRRPTFLGRLTLTTAASIHKYRPLHKAVLGSRKVLERIASDLSFVTDEEILKSFQLAHHESETIGRDQNPIEIKSEHRNKIHVFYTRRDTWCHSFSIKELKKIVSVQECSEPHGFVTLEKHRLNLFQRIMKLP